MRLRVTSILNALGITDFDTVEVEIDDDGEFEVEVEIRGDTQGLRIEVVPDADGGTRYDVRTSGLDGGEVRYEVRVESADQQPRDTIQSIVSAGSGTTLTSEQEDALLSSFGAPTNP